MGVKIGMVSLGCAKNQVDAELLLGRLAEAGHTLVSDAAAADVAIVNTCGFIEDAKKEAIDEILGLAARKKENRIKKLLVTGCLAERYREEIMREMPEVDGVIGIGANADIVRVVEELLRDERPEYFPDKLQMPMSGQRVQSTPAYYAYLKVADGCDNRCSYCAIPMIRGRFRSRPIEELLEEARALAENGVKELLVIAQDTTRYGEDLYGEIRLPELLRGLCAIPELRWIRLLYCYPDRVTDELIDVIAREDKIVKYVDLPLQHCNDRILGDMNRHFGKAQIVELLRKMRARIPGLTLRTTLIAGLPGEGEEAFEELAHFVREQAFERLGCFAYSPEEGTRAGERSDQVEESVRLRRQEIIMAEQERISAAHMKAQVGKTLTVLTEGFDRRSGTFSGRSAADAPGIDGKIFFTAGGAKPRPGNFVTVRVTDSMDYDLIGVCLDNGEKGNQEA